MTWLGHSTFLLQSPGGKRILFDPWVTGNPRSPESAKKLGALDLILVTHGHSDQLHLTQRFSRPDLGHLTYEVIVDDPKTFTKTWKNVRTLWLRPDWEMMEYSCEENNKSLWEGRIKVPKYKP